MRTIDPAVPENKISRELMDCFYKVHVQMGPGLHFSAPSRLRGEKVL
jgi:hypothetical protein